LVKEGIRGMKRCHASPGAGKKKYFRGGGKKKRKRPGKRHRFAGGGRETESNSWEDLYRKTTRGRKTLGRIP